MTSSADDLACESLHAFADGELEPTAAAAFRLHLAECARCEAGLLDLMQMQALGRGLLREPVPTVPAVPARRRVAQPRWTGRRVWTGAGAGVAALAALLVAVLVPRSGEGGLPLNARARGLEARLTVRGAARFRPYEVVRGGDAHPVEAVPLATLAKLESAGDFRALGEAHLLRGELDSAAADLARAPPSPDVDSDRAVLALQRRQLEDALALLDSVLEREPRHAVARFNRGLVLRELSLPSSAAAEFRAVAQLAEPGWSSEAATRAEALEASVQERGARWNALWKDGVQWATGGTTPDVARAVLHPGLARLLFYDALRAAPSAERARALLPLAFALDAKARSTVLVAELTRVAGSDFQTRAPLAARYRAFLSGTFDAHDGDAFLAEVTRADAPDLLLGTLYQLGRIGTHLDAYRAAAKAVHDPWFERIADNEEAKHALAAGELDRAEQLLKSALLQCDGSAIAYRCAELEGALTGLLLQEQRLDEARAHALVGLGLARQSAEFGQESHFLGHLGNEARMREKLALSAAYLGEMERRAPGMCPVREYVHEALALMNIQRQRFEPARTELLAAMDCGAPLSLWGLTALGDVYRVLRHEEDGKAVLAALDALEQGGTLSASERVVAVQDRGRVVSVTEPLRGEVILADAIAQAEALPREDQTAQKARAYSYAYRVLSAGERQSFDRALTLMAEEARTALPSRCVLGVEILDERRLLVVRGADGKTCGAQSSVPGEAPLEVQRLVPAAFVEALRPCERVEVLARYPVHGRPGLLPAGLAWGYRISTLAPAASSGPPRRLVVSDVEAPADLHLPRLQAVRVPSGGDVTHLSGAEATPARVLEALRTATEVTLHAHGIVSAEVSDASFVVLSPGPDGRYALTARDVRREKLAGAPLVVLAACRAATSAPYLHAPWSLPAAFLEAGARAVLASTEDLPDADAARFFEAVEVRIRQGASPSGALRDERLAWQKQGASWVEDVVVFD